MNPLQADARLTASQLLRHFDITTMNAQKPLKSTCYGLFYVEDFEVRVTARA